MKGTFFGSTWNHLKKNTKLFFTSKLMVTMLAVSILLCFIFSYGLLSVSKEQSRIIVGIVDDDESTLSKEFMERANGNESVAIVPDSYENLYKKLRNGDISFIYTIKSGFEEHLKKGEFQGLIEVVVPTGNTKYRVVSDMLGGDLIDEICLNQAGNYYREFTKQDKKNYNDYYDEIKEDERFIYRFDVQTVAVDGAPVMTETELSVLYQQVVAAFMGMVMSFVLMEAYLYVSFGYNNPVLRREKVTPFGTGSYHAGIFCFYLLFLLILNIVTMAVLFFGLTAAGKNWNFSVYFSMFFWELLAGLCNYVIFYIGRAFIKNEHVCHMAGLMVLFLSGAVSVAGLFLPAAEAVGNYIPLFHMMKQMIQ